MAVAVVIGVGPGTGAAVAKRFAKEGYKIGLISRSQDSLAPVQAAVEQAGSSALSITADASKPEDITAALQRVTRELGSPEVLVYNAGPRGKSWPPPDTLDLEVEDLQSALDIGVTGAFVAAKEVLPSMVQLGHGTILLTGATAALRGRPKFALLSVPKFALRSLGQILAREFGPKGIHVAHIIVDGVIDTPRSKAYSQNKTPDAVLSADAIAETYWQLHIQHRSCWSQEIDVRPYVEAW